MQVAGGISLRTARILCAVIIVFSVALRLGFVATLEDDLYWPDPQYYDLVAWKIASGEPLGDSLMRAPFQAFVMAVPYAVAGHSYQAAYVFQAFLGGLIPLLLLLIGTRLKGYGVGLVAAFLSAVYPSTSTYPARSTRPRRRRYCCCWSSILRSGRVRRRAYLCSCFRGLPSGG
ncbi:hypothetical protein KAW64_16555 [bacterium]|nr:hypothetical protein [bacterium]